MKAWFLLLIFAATAAEAKVSYENILRLRWKPVTRATKYQVEIDRDGKEVAKRTLAETELTEEVTPGKYRYRVRCVDAAGREGPWSVAREAVVKPGPPLPSESQRKEIPFIGTPVEEALSWEESKDASAYRLRVYKGEEVLLEKDLEGATASFRISAVGRYRYEVASVRAGIVGPFSPAFEFSAVEFKLAGPAELAPRGRRVLHEGDEIKMSWAPVKGAEVYEIRLVRQKKWRTAIRVKSGPPTAGTWKAGFKIKGADSPTTDEGRPPEARAPAAAAEEFSEKTIKSTANSVTIPALPEGTWYWSVRALAGVEEGKPATASGPEAKAELDVVRP